MELREPSTVAGSDALRAILADPGRTLLGLDFDGTLAPIVQNPEQAYVHPGAVAALRRVAPLVRAVVIITGRPVETALRLGGFRDDPELVAMVIAGQYGNEVWDAATDTVSAEPEPAGIGPAETEICGLLDDFDLPARLEHKGRALGVHTRELPDPAGAFEALREPLTEIAGRHGLQLEPGRNVLELRGQGKDKGDALRSLVAEKDAGQVVFVGDDLGDLPAFEAVIALREQGIPGLLVCSASEEQDALTSISDVVVDGPDGVAGWLTQLADALEQNIE
ncbi:MAG: trehalose-phosphatase [Propionibacteriaceae bacterium]